MRKDEVSRFSDQTVSATVRQYVPPFTPEELLKCLYADVMFLEGISYALQEEAGKHIRRRIINMYRNVKDYLKMSPD